MDNLAQILHSNNFEAKHWNNWTLLLLPSPTTTKHKTAGGVRCTVLSRVCLVLVIWPGVHATWPRRCWCAGLVPRPLAPIKWNPLVMSPGCEAAWDHGEDWFLEKLQGWYKFSIFAESRVTLGREGLGSSRRRTVAQADAAHTSILLQLTDVLPLLSGLTPGQLPRQSGLGSS